MKMDQPTDGRRNGAMEGPTDKRNCRIAIHNQKVGKRINCGDLDAMTGFLVEKYRIFCYVINFFFDQGKTHEYH